MATKEKLIYDPVNDPAQNKTLQMNAGDTGEYVKLNSSAGNTSNNTTAGNNTTGATAPTAPSTSAIGNGTNTSGNTSANYPDAPEYQKYTYDKYAASETVQQADAVLKAIQAAQPGAYQSKWQNQIDGIINRILNREEFSYDVNEDALYQQYKDQYIQAGKLAMQDSMGQAAAMTGGYGNSYAATVGNQAYQNYLSQLNEVVPELYGMALDRYNQEGQEMYNQYGLLNSQEQQDYARYQDSYNQWLTERDYATGRYDTEYERDYNKYLNDVNLGYQVHTDEQNRAWNEYVTGIQNAQFDANFGETVRQNNIANDQWNQSFDASEEQRGIDNEHWEKSFDETVRQNDIGNSQWEQSFTEQQKQNEIANDQWQQSFDEGVKQNAIGNSQWEKSFAEQQKQNAIGNQQWQQSFDENVKQNAIGNEQWQQSFDTGNEQWATSRQDAIDSENRAYAREEVLAIIANGGTPDSKMLKTAGLTKAAAEAMAVVSSGNQKAALEHVSSMSSAELVETMKGYNDAGDNAGLAAFLDDCEASRRLTPEQADAYYEKYRKENGHTITDTTVATPSGSSSSGSGGRGFSGISTKY